MERQKLLIIVVVVAIALIGILAFGLKKEKKLQRIELEFWSTYEDEKAYTELIKAYEGQNKAINKSITIKYVNKPFVDFEKDLINALAAGAGPDVFSIHNTWLPRYKDKIYPMPQTEGFMSLKTFQDTFIDVAYSDFIAKEEKTEEKTTGIFGGAEKEEEAKEQIYAIPLYIDTLALYYNKDFFNSAGIAFPPATWDEFLDDVELLTKRDKRGNIERAGAAIGTAQNINRSTDILSLLMLQTGTEMVDKNHTQATFDKAVLSAEKSFDLGKDALRFYTDFSNPTKRVFCWNREMPYSIDAFYQGKAAMMINYSHHIQTIRSKSPYLNFGVAPVPQIKDREFDINYANYWAQTVSKGSKHQNEAWKFILFLTDKENVKKYLEKAKRPTSRKDLIAWQKDDSDLGVFVKQILSARTWYQIDSQAIEKIFADMIESVVSGGQTLDKAIVKAANQITALMKKTKVQEELEIPSIGY